MADPVIVPPTPTINQGSDPGALEQAEANKNVQNIFDRVMPARGGPEKTAPPADPTPKTPEPPVRPPEIPLEPPPPDVKPPETEPVRQKIPSFIEEALRIERPADKAPVPPGEDWPETPPEFKTPEEKTSRYKAWRESYNSLKKERDELRTRPSEDPVVKERMGYLESENKTLHERLNQYSIETNTEFQQKVIQPMQRAWQEAARIVHENGGDYQALAQALQLSGKAQYEALDGIYADLPQSAQMDVQQAVNAYRHLDAQRRNALRDSPRTVAELKKRDMERQMSFLEGQRKEMGQLFDEAVRKLRDEAKIEVYQKSNSPDAQWWNEQGDDAIALSKTLYLDNTDMGKMAMACLLAPLADVYRKLWLSERMAREKSDSIIGERFGSEPRLSESGGPGSNGRFAQDDLKRPFTDVFLEKFHQLQREGR